MQAHKKTLSFINNDPNLVFRIPYFQRAYVWEKDEWEDLLKTFFESEDGKHFLGSLILKEDEKSDDLGNRVYNIIDGQQRLTTLFILLRVCYEIILKVNKNETNNEKKKRYEKMAEKILNTLFIPKDKFSEIDEKESEIRIIHSINDKKDFEAIIRGKENASGTESRIQQAYKYFSGINEEGNDVLNIEKVEKISNIVFGAEEDDNPNMDNLFISIKLTGRESAQKIFNTINSQGVKLTCAENIKNYLFQKYENNEKNNGLDLYKSTWAVVFDEKSAMKFWNTTMGKGIQARTFIDHLLQIVAINLGLFKPDQNDLIDKLDDYYETYVNNKTSIQIKELIHVIIKYAIIYRTLFENISSIDGYNNYHKRIAQILYNSGAMTLCPYLLKIFIDEFNENVSNYDDFEYILPDSNKIKKRIFELESLVMRCILCSDNASKIKNFTKKIAPIMRDSNFKAENFINDIIKDEKKHDLRITNQDIRRGIKSLNNNNAKLALFWIELYRNKDIQEGKDLNINYNYSLEHVMPQNYTANYKVDEHPVYNEDNKIVEDFDKASEIRQGIIYSIGNMTLSKIKANIRYRDSYIDVKVEGKINSKRGSTYKDNVSLLITHDIIEKYEENMKNKKREKNDLWNEKDIREREEKIYKEIIKIWKEPKEE